MIPASMGLRFQVPADLEAFRVVASWGIYETVESDRVIGEMLVNADRIIQNIEVNEDRRGEGIARALWDYANAESPVLHQVEHHRTWEGNAFAEAVGGDTDMSVTDAAEAELVDAQARVESAKAGYDHWPSGRRRCAGGSTRAGRCTGPGRSRACQRALSATHSGSAHKPIGHGIIKPQLPTHNCS
jgi:hypothetical protein